MMYCLVVSEIEDVLRLPAQTDRAIERITPSSCLTHGHLATNASRSLEPHAPRQSGAESSVPSRPASTAPVILDQKSKIYNRKPLLKQPYGLRLLHRWNRPQLRQHLVRHSSVDVHYRTSGLCQVYRCTIHCQSLM